MANASSRPVQVTYGLMGMVMAAFTVAGVVLTLAIVQPILLVLALIAFGPVWLVARRLSRLSYTFDVDETEADRRRSYLLMLLTFKAPAKEVRAYDLEGFLSGYHERLWDERIDRLQAYTSRRVRLGVAGQIINGLLFGAVVALLVYLLSSGRTTVSDARFAAGAVLLLGQRMGVLIGSGGRSTSPSLFLGDVQDFLDGFARDDAAHEATSPAGTLDRLSAEHVSFRYPSGTSDALNDVSMEVRRGEVVALVGANGSGKTTLAKVLAHLYEPADGSLAWNNTDTRELDPVDIRDQTAVIFQDFERYLFTAGENVAFGRHEQMGDSASIAEAAERAGASSFIASLPHGYETLLGPEFIGGSDLSIGQWQRIAIARAFFRRRQPRDPRRAQLGPRRRRRGGTVRAAPRTVRRPGGRGGLAPLSTVTTADRIYVLDGGSVVEHGTHAELLTLGGTYARMFHLQAAQYLDQTEAPVGQRRSLRSPRSARKASRSARASEGSTSYTSRTASTMASRVTPPISSGHTTAPAPVTVR